MLILDEMKVFDGVDSPTVSEPYNNYKGDLVTIQISGDATTLSLKLEGKSDIAAPWTPVSVINLEGIEVSGDMNKKAIYQTQINGLKQIRLNLESCDDSVDVTWRITN